MHNSSKELPFGHKSIMHLPEEEAQRMLILLPKLKIEKITPERFQQVNSIITQEETEGGAMQRYKQPKENG